VAQTWKFWLDLRNLTDETYASTVTPGFNDQGLDATRYTPGQGLSGYAGIAIHF
jgi:iron complex outermembrane recepter protein